MKILILFCVYLFIHTFNLFGQYALYNQISSMKSYYESPHFHNPSFIGLNKNELGITAQRGNSGRLFSLDKKYEYYLSANAIFCSKDSVHKSSVSLLMESHAVNRKLSSENTLTLMFARSFFINNIEIRPAIALGVRYDYQNLPELYEIRPYVYDSIKPTFSIKNYSSNIGVSLLILYKNFKLGASIKNIFVSYIPSENTRYNLNRSICINASKSIYFKRNIFEPFLLINIHYIDGFYVAGFNSFFRWNNYNQCNVGVNITKKKMIYGIRAGAYPPVKMGFRPFRNYLHLRMRPKEFGLSLGRKIFSIELIYNLDFISPTIEPVFNFYFTNITYHNLSMRYQF